MPEAVEPMNKFMGNYESRPDASPFSLNQS